MVALLNKLCRDKASFLVAIELVCAVTIVVLGT
jgi:hypothetical protein